MGAAGSSIKNYQLGQPYTNVDASLKVTVCPATNIIDGQKYTVFQFAKENGRLSENAERYIEVLRTTRHPYILRYLALFSDSYHETVVTEHVIPLDVAVEKQEKEEIYAGLRNVLESLIFLHEKSFICHNSISVSSIYVSDDGEWKLASFENSSKVLRLSKKSFDSDITGYSEFSLSVLEYLKDDSETTRAFMKKLEEELAVENKEVCTLKPLLEDPFFKFPYVEALDGVQKLPLKSNEDKLELFRDLHDVLQALSPYVVCRRFIPILFSHMVITDPIANDLFMPHLFASGNDYCLENGYQPLFDKEHFIKYSLPKILSLYELRDVTVRLTVMKYLPLYVDCIDKDILQEEILPELLIGLKDTNDKIVQETFLALASIVGILGGKIVVGGESFAYFHDRKPDFSRSNHDMKENGNIATKVGDILSAKKPGQNTVDKMIQERKLKRLERAKQRDEQRKIREQRKLEREAAKMKKQETRKKETPAEQTETISQNLEDTVQNSLEISASSEANEKDEKSEGTESEAEWEGFEVQSNSSDQEGNDSADLVSPVTGYNGNTNGNDIELPPISNKNQTEQMDEQRIILSNSKQNLSFKEPTNEILDYINSQITPGISASQNTTKSNDLKKGRQNGQENKLPKPKGMSLSGAKKVKPKIDIEKKDVKDSKSKEKLAKKPIDLGNEFDIKISKNKFTMEPDYFADMVPSFEKKKTVLIEKDSTVNSKFSVDLSHEESPGWDDDGWGNDEEII